MNYLVIYLRLYVYLFVFDRYVVICEIGFVNVIYNRGLVKIIILLVWCVLLCVLFLNLVFQKFDKRVNVKFVDGVFIMDGFKFICVEFFLNEYGSCIYIVVIYMCFYLFLVLIMVFSYG